MYRLLKPKNIHRALIGLILFAPLAYLFGTQISALAGAHGEELFAEPVYVEGEIESDSFNENTNKIVLDSVEEKTEWLTYVFGAGYSPTSITCSFNGVVGQITYGVWDNSTKTFLFRVTASGAYNNIAAWTSSGGISIRDNSPTWTFESSNNARIALITYGYEGFTYYESGLVPSYTVPENAGAYTDYLFGDMFGKSNFLTDWGEDALSENRHGFAPVGELFKYVDDNMLHLSDKQIGLMGYGYMYYVVHVLIFDIVAMAFVFIVTIPQKVMNMLNEKSGGDM